MMEFTKNKNIVTITVAPKKAYTIDINTGTVYAEKVSNKETFVCFIRKKQNPDKSYISCEVDKKGKIKQFKLAYNSEITSEKDINFRKKYQEYLNGVWNK